jgi:hypothetical protein
MMLGAPGSAMHVKLQRGAEVREATITRRRLGDGDVLAVQT